MGHINSLQQYKQTKCLHQKINLVRHQREVRELPVALERPVAWVAQVVKVMKEHLILECRTLVDKADQALVVVVLVVVQVEAVDQVVSVAVQVEPADRVVLVAVQAKQVITINTNKERYQLQIIE